MFTELIKAVDSLGLKPGKSVSFEKLSKDVLTPAYQNKHMALSPFAWKHHLRSPGAFVLIREDMLKAGYDLVERYTPRRTWRFVKL